MCFPGEAMFAFKRFSSYRAGTIFVMHKVPRVIKVIRLQRSGIDTIKYHT